MIRVHRTAKENVESSSLEHTFADPCEHLLSEVSYIACLVATVYIVPAALYCCN
jgi:hypothetical protein